MSWGDRLRRWTALLAGLAALYPAGGAASSHLVVMGAGDCGRSELLGVMRALSTELALRPGIEVLAPDDVPLRLGPPPRVNAPALQRQLEAAQAVLWEGKNEQARAGLEEAAEQISRLAPGEERLRLEVQVRVLKAIVLRGMGLMEEAEVAFGELLRLEPAYQLDPDLFPPSIRARFEKQRKAMEAASRVRLTVSSQPSGAQVFLDGVGIGVTPLEGQVVPGRYQLVVAKGEAVSLPHHLELEGDQNVLVDLAFEGSVHPGRLACVASHEDEPSRLGAGVKLGARLEVEEVVLVRLDRPDTGPGWLTATVVEVRSGQKVREGGLELTFPDLTPGLEELAAFIVTGQRTGKVVTVGGRRESTQPKAQPSAPEVRSGRGTRAWAGLGLAAAGLAAAGAGTLFQAQASGTWAEFNGYYANGKVPSLEELPKLTELRGRAQGQQVAAVAGFGVATALLTSGALLYFWGAEAPAAAGWAGPAGAGLTVRLALP